MGPILILLFIVYLCTRDKDKKRKRHNSYNGKTWWENECDDGAKFYGW
jgi:hypothetical protein